MAVTEDDVQAFADAIQRLFVPWQDAQVAPTITGRDDGSGHVVYEFSIDLQGVPYGVSTAMQGSDLVLTGPPTMAPGNPERWGWVAIPSHEQPEHYEATIADPAGADPDMVTVNATTDVPQVLQGDVSTALVPAHRT